MKNTTFHISGSIVLLLFCLIFFTTRCHKKEAENVNPEHQPSAYQLAIPDRFPEPDIPASNPMTHEGVKLGRMLYYDTLLSRGGPHEGQSCSSCHRQEDGFSTAGTTALPHLNLAWNRSFLWKGNIEGSLEDAMRFEVRDFFQADLSHLKRSQQYPALYDKAFGSEEITLNRTARALAQFLRTIISADSKFDRYLQGDAGFTTSEARGLEVFNSEKGDCFHCHNLTLFTDGAFHNTGLESTFEGEDRGRFLVTGDSADMGKFKTPTLRNVALRPPYMHDGRFETLYEVVEHYNAGIVRSPTLAPVLVNPGQDLALHLSEQEKQDLVAFLKTLTDTACTTNSELGRP